MTLKNETNLTMEENAENSDITSLMSYDSSHSKRVARKEENVNNIEEFYSSIPKHTPEVNFNTNIDIMKIASINSLCSTQKNKYQ